MAFGAICRNAKQQNGTKCSDYKIRVCCVPKVVLPSLSPCGGNITKQNEGTILKSKYDDEANVDSGLCVWTIETDPGTSIQLEITQLADIDCIEVSKFDY